MRGANAPCFPYTRKCTNAHALASKRDSPAPSSSRDPGAIVTSAGSRIRPYWRSSRRCHGTGALPG